MVSALVHGGLLAAFSLVAISPESNQAEIVIRALRPAQDTELEQLVTQQVVLQSLPRERPEFNVPESAAGNQTDAGDIGGALEAQLVTDIDDDYRESGTLESSLAQALLEGNGGPGTGSGRVNGRDASFGGLVAYSHEHGLDVVIAMDSTGSMGREIEATKRKIMAIGGMLLKKVPEARLSIVSYKDLDDDYVVRGVALTSDLEKVQRFLNSVKAGGGGDPPEAVEAGLEWSIGKNEFRPHARKVILLFGDRPPHDKDLAYCLSLAGEFHHQQGGIVSTISCRHKFPIPHFHEIARAGGGEAFTLKDSRRILEELLVLVFGTKHRHDVAEFFELDDVDE